MKKSNIIGKGKTIINSQAHTKKPFTLIELLAVIAIIGMLLSIVMPALRKAKEYALTVRCQSNVKQWSPIISTFALDNKDRFPDPDFNNDGATDGNGHWWIQALRPMMIITG